jgi:DNA-binding XRE family transcriptional regulator
MTDIETALRLTTELEDFLKSKFVDPAQQNSVRPTRPAYGSILGLPESDSAFAIQFKEKLSERNRPIRNHFIWQGSERKLKLFRLLSLESSSCGDYDTTVATFLQYLLEERLLLNRELAEIDSAALSDEFALGDKLKKVRKHKKETQETVAEFVGCDVSTICRIENGEQKPRKHAEAIQVYIARPE